MQGALLTKAMDWFNRAVSMEDQGKIPMMDKCLDKALEFERQGIAAGESWS